MANPALIARAAAIILTDEKARKAVGWALVAILSPLILLIAFLCSLGSGSAEHNITTVELCFYDTVAIPADIPEEYRQYVETMRTSFAQLDTAIAAIQENMEEGISLNNIRVKAIFYALYFGAEHHGDAQAFVDCFVTWEDRTRMVPVEGSDPPVETEEAYVAAIPIEDLGTIWQNIASVMGVMPTTEQKANANSVYSLIKYGWGGNGTGGAWSGDIGEPVLSVDGFCSPLGARWQSMVTSEYGWRTCPYHGWELHSGLDMSAATGTPIRAALSGTVTKSCRTSSYGNYTVIDHGNGMTTAYAHQSERLVKVGDVVNVGQVIGLVGSTGNSTGSHLHLEVRVNSSLVNPRSYLP